MKNLILSLISIIMLATVGCQKENVNPQAPTPGPTSQQILTFRFIADQSNFDYNTSMFQFDTDHLRLTVYPTDSIQISITGGNNDTTLWLSDGETYVDIDSFRFYKTSTFIPMFFNGDTLTYIRDVTGTDYASFFGGDNNWAQVDNGDVFVYLNNNLIASDLYCDGDTTQSPMLDYHLQLNL